MAIQYMAVRTGLPLVIETPMGMISIRFDTGRRKKLMISLPDGICVHRGEERAMKNLQFLARREDGGLEPTYSILAPDVDEDGRIRGVRKPQRFSLATPA